MNSLKAIRQFQQVQAYMQVRAAFCRQHIMKIICALSAFAMVSIIQVENAEAYAPYTAEGTLSIHQSTDSYAETEDMSNCSIELGLGWSTYICAWKDGDRVSYFYRLAFKVKLRAERYKLRADYDIWYRALTVDSYQERTQSYRNNKLIIQDLTLVYGDVDYYYDGTAVIEEHNASDDSLLAHYRYADRLLSLETRNPQPATQYYHHDALGSTVNLTDDLGGIQVSYKLDPWGHIKSQTGTSVNRQIFTGQEHDENTGLIYFGARYYDPDTARFITQDSYLGEPGTPPSLHRYLYAYGNPTVYVDLYGDMSVTTELEKAELKAAEEGKNLKLAGLSTLHAGYKLADFITFGWISKHDEARDKYDRGEISFEEYAGDSAVAAAKSGALIAATAVTGGVAGVATRGLSLTTRLAVTGAATGVGYQAAEDVMDGEFSGVGVYLRSAGLGAGGGVLARGFLGLNKALGKASITEGMQVLKSAAKQKAQILPKISSEVRKGLHDAGQKILQKTKTAISKSPLGNEIGAVGDVRRAYLNQKFRGRANISLNEAISAGKGYSRRIKTQKKVIYIGKNADLQGIPRNQTLLPELKPNLGSVKANWYRNASVLRRKIWEGYEIRDASKLRKLSDADPIPTWPERKLKQSFLGAERNLMKNKSFKLNLETGIYE